MTDNNVVLEDGYVLANTDMLMQLMAEGHTLRLPGVSVDDPFVLEHFTDDEISHLNLDGDMNDIVSIEYVGEMPVQCISIDDPEHLYLTDDFIPTHNTSNIVFLKSTDDEMLDTLEKMSGKTHRSYIESKQVTHDIGSVFFRTEGRVMYTMQTVEEPVIKYNDMAFISERNSIVFRAGDAPVWNRNQTVLPMSWRLFKDKITDPGKEYTLQTIPTLSSALDFDVRQNQPNFHKMLDKRIAQAAQAAKATKRYMDAYQYSEYDMQRLDPDVVADDIMDIISDMVAHQERQRRDIEDMIKEAAAKSNGESVDEEEKARRKQAARLAESNEAKDVDAYGSMHADDGDEPHALGNLEVVDNEEQRIEIEKSQAEKDEHELTRYAKGLLSRDNLIDISGTSVNHQYDGAIVFAYHQNIHGMHNEIAHFKPGPDNGLLSRDGKTPYIVHEDNTEFKRKLEDGIADENSRTFSEDRKVSDDIVGSFVVTDEFIKYMCSLDSWNDICNGKFNNSIAAFINQHFDQ